LPIENLVDINLDLSQVQARIAQISGAAPAIAPALGGGSFSTLVNGLVQAHVGAAAGALQWPVAGNVTSGFGERKNPLGAGDDFHPGLDIAAETGTPIAAAAAGRVISAGPDGGYGNLIVLDNGNGVTTRYAHCSQILARVGEIVGAGQTIGAVGSTGASTGPHLHFEVRVGDKPVDPAQYLAR
jgi:murein DD-endopeptidase MepM/ murein hydrolase activator NlpD